MTALVVFGRELVAEGSQPFQANEILRTRMMQSSRRNGVIGVVYAGRVAEKRTQSLQPILEEVRAERAAQLGHFDALDAKAGIVLGFAGALVALAPAGNLVVDIGRFAAVASGLSALSAFWPRGYWATNLRNLRNLYLASEPEFTQLRVLDTQIAMVETLGTVLRSKGRRLKIAMIALALAALLTAVGLAID